MLQLKKKLFPYYSLVWYHTHLWNEFNSRHCVELIKMKNNQTNCVFVPMLQIQALSFDMDEEEEDDNNSSSEDEKKPEKSWQEKEEEPVSGSIT